MSKIEEIANNKLKGYRKIKVGNVYRYIFNRNSTECETIGETDLNIEITHIRSGVIFYIVHGHPELGEQHFEVKSYMSEHLELIN